MSDEKMRDRHTQYIMMKKSPEQQNEAIIRHYAATAALSMQGIEMLNAKRAGIRGDAMDDHIEHIAYLLKKAHRNDFGVSLPFIDQASAAQSAERIKLLEQQNEQLQAQVAMLLDVLTNEEGSHSDFQDAVNRTTQTAEAYKRRVQAEALDAAILRLDMTDWPPTKSSAQILRRMASKLLKEGE